MHFETPRYKQEGVKPFIPNAYLVFDIFLTTFAPCQPKTYHFVDSTVWDQHWFAITHADIPR